MEKLLKLTMFTLFEGQECRVFGWYCEKLFSSMIFGFGWYMWCLTTLYATKLVFHVQPVLRDLTTPEFSPDLLWTLLEWYSPLLGMSPSDLLLAKQECSQLLQQGLIEPTDSDWACRQNL